MHIKRTALALLLAATAAAQAQTKNDYETAVGRFRAFYNNKQPDSVFSLFSERVKSVLPLDKTGPMLTKLYAEFGEMKQFRLTNIDDRFSYYKTDFEKGVMTLVVFLNPENQLQSFRFIPYQQDSIKSNIVLKSASGNIYGTLTTPENTNGKVPVVLIIPGSGPTDRDGNNTVGVTANTYRLIADSLKNAGIACVRYDKRGVGESGTKKGEESMRFDEMVDDAYGLLQQLKDDSRFSKVIVLGHSEGSLIGMIAAEKGKAAAYISAAGLAERADKIIEQQIGAQSKELAAMATVLLDSLVNGYMVTYVPPELSTLLRPSVMPYIMSWLKYDPQAEIKKLTGHTLIIQGTTDIQVDVRQAELLKKARPTATLKVIKGMNHVLKPASQDRQQNIAVYSNPGLPLAPGFMPAVIQFIKAN